MRDQITATLKINPAIQDVIDRMPYDIQVKVMPPLMIQASKVLEAAMKVKLKPHDSRETGTINKQSKSARERWTHRTDRDPTGTHQHTMDRVTHKIVKDETGVLAVVGVDNRAPQVRIDHGNKALTEGRTHIYWGRVPDPPVLRRQQDDIKTQVIVEQGDKVLRIIETGIINAVKAGAVG